MDADSRAKQRLAQRRMKASPPPSGFLRLEGRTVLALSDEHRKAMAAHRGCPCMHTREYAAALREGDVLAYLAARHLVPAGFTVVGSSPGFLGHLLLTGPGVADEDPTPLYSALRTLPEGE